MFKKIIFLILFFITSNCFAAQRILYDMDAANDDAIALAYLANQKSVDLVAVTVTGVGEAHVPRGAENMADLLYVFGKPQVPIGYGSSKPLDHHGKFFPDFIREMMDHVFEDMGVPRHPHPDMRSSAVELIRESVEASNVSITIVATGPLTNIAQFIQKFPKLSKRINKIVIMGGAVRVKGNIKALLPDSDNDVAEWNIYADPKAAEIVFNSEIPVVLVPLDATNQIPMTREFYESLSVQQRPALKLVYQLLKKIVDKFGMEMFLKEFYLWDPTAAMIAVAPGLAEYEILPIRMNLETANIELVDQGAAKIKVATSFKNPDDVLKKLVEDIK